jgi:glucan phosphoethanolaminetransferase (alkaline phosphatase superfamily)
MTVPSALRRIAYDLVIWYALTAAFLLCYVLLFARPASAVAPHLLVSGAAFAALALARLALSSLVRPPALRNGLSALVTFAALSLVLIYYLFAIVSLRFWGGVVAYNVIPTFFAQGPQLVDALGIPSTLVIGALVIVSACLLAGCSAYLRQADWTVSACTSRPRLAACVAAAVAMLSAGSWGLLSAAWIDRSEPVSLTLFPDRGTRDVEGHHIDPHAAATLDTLEDSARAAYEPSATATRRNLIVIVVDALRPDHMGVFGYPRDTTPNLSRLGRTAEVRKMVAHASCADTICGLMSLADSKFPRRFSFHAFGLPEVLRRNGYRVHMILSGDHTHFYSMKGYYGSVDSFYDGNDARGYSLNDDQQVVDRLAAMPRFDGTPTMFQFHLMSVHTLRTGDDGGEFQPARRYIPTTNQGFAAPDRPDENAINFYDNGVVKADAVIGKLLDSLKGKGYLDNALVVVTADHGESLGEHGLYGHGNSIREEVLRIPLILLSYGYWPSRAIDANLPPLQVDIAPTILAEFAIAQPRTWAGRPLQLSPGLPFSYFEEHLYSGLIDARDPAHLWKYWTDSQTEHAFNLSDDREESHDLIATVPSEVRREWRVQAALGTPGARVAEPLTGDNLHHSLTISPAVVEQ